MKLRKVLKLLIDNNRIDMYADHMYPACHLDTQMFGSEFADDDNPRR